MQTAKIIKSGRGQAVRLPREFHFDDTEVYIKKVDNMVILLPRKDSWASLVNSLDNFSDDFMDDREQPEQQERESL